MSDIQLYNADCLDILPTLDDGSVDAVVTDPPYYKVKGDWWDRQWKTAEGFLAWLDDVLAELYRVLKPNGSLYIFASPKMAARVEVVIGGQFNVLNRIRWIKEAGWHNKTEKEALRSYLSPWEEIIFAENYGADGYAKGEAGYVQKCDELRGFVFESLRAYLDGERVRAGVSKEDINESLGFRRMGGMAGRHYFSQSQWQLPTEEHYTKMRKCLSRLNHGGEYLRREYEDLRRPFSVTADVPYTDVWTFPTVQGYEGKHPTEKPLSLMQHIIKTSTRENATVLDCFAGSGTTGVACVQTGRNFVGIEIDADYFAIAEKRIAEAQMQPQLEMA